MINTLDKILADALEVPVEEYIRKIEATTLARGELILNAILSGEDSKIEKAKRIFKLIK